MMAETQEAGATLSLQKTVMDPEIKMEGEEDSVGEAREPSFLPKPSVKEEPEEGPSGNWDAQLREFVMMLQAHHSSGETLQLPERRQEDDGKTARAPFQSGTEDLKGPQIQPRCIGENHKEPPTLLEATPRAKRQEEAELWRQHFRTLCYQDAEGPRELCGQLLECCRQWLKPERHTKEQIVELVALEQFLAVLPLEMQSWVRGKDPETCAEAATLAEDFLLSQRNAKGVGQQITGMCEEESLNNPPNAKRVPPGTEEMEVFVETKQEGGESAAVLAGDGGWLREKAEREPLPPRPVKMERGAMFWGAAAREDGLFWGEPEENEQRGKRRAEGKEGSGKDLDSVCKSLREYIGLHGDCKSAPQNKNPQNEKGGGSMEGNAALPPHESSGAAEKPYKCWHCGLTFASSSDLLSHERDHVGERLYTCSQCGRSERIYMGPKPSKCSHCGNTLGCRPKKETSGRKIHVCMMCSEEYTELASLLRHQDVHRGAENFGTHSALQAHGKIHRAGYGQLRENDDDEALMKCLRKRQQPATFLRKNKGNGCLLQGEPEGNEQKAKRQKEEEKEDEEGEDLYYVCEGASRAAVHQDENPLYEECGENVPLPSDESGGAEPKLYPCWYCGLPFASSSDLLSHERTHVGEKLYKCSQCGESERIREGQEPDACWRCGNAFSCDANEDKYSSQDIIYI